MTSIEKLQISGIRSFDPNAANAQSITFMKPLTVILGKNGAGKTTIIEALLNACTGELPPGTGTEKSSFVYDPKVAGESQVKAQIRLVFGGRAGAVVQVIRSFQSTQSRNAKAKFETLDSVVAVMDEKTGEVSSNSYRAGDADRLVPELLGVSPAVLEHVIFCHQEDCNWPLGPPSEVKKNFDAIFAATRYVAALENLRDSRKKYSKELDEAEGSLIELREHREQAQGIQKSIQRKEEDIQALHARNRSIDPQLQQLRQAAAALEHVRQQTESLTVESAVIQGKIQEKLATAKRSRLPPTKQSLEELREMHKHFDTHMAALQRDVTMKSSRIEASETARRRAEEDLATCRASLQYLTQQETEHKKRCAILKDEVSKLSSEFVVGETTVDERALQRVMETIIENIRSSKLSFSEKQKAFEVEKDSATQQRDDTLRSMDSDAKERDLLEQQLSGLRQRLSQLQVELSELHGCVEHKKACEQEVQSLEGRLEALRETRRQGARHKQTVEIQRKIEQKNSEVASLRVEIKARKEMGNQESEIPFLRNAIAKKQLCIDEKLPLLIQSLQGVGPQPKSNDVLAVAAAVEQLRDLKQNALQQADREIVAMERATAVSEQQLQQKKSALSTAEREMQQNKSVCASALGESFAIEEYEVRLHAAQEAEVRACRHVTSIESMSKCYESFVSSAKKDHHCLVCKRGLDEHALPEFIKLNEDRQKMTPEQLDKAKKEWQAATKAVELLRQVGPAVTELLRIQSQIPELRGSVRMLMDDLATKRSLLSDLRNKRTSLESQSKQAQEMDNEVRVLSDASNEVMNLTKTLNEALRVIGSNTTSGITLDELQISYENAIAELQSLNEKLQELNRDEGGAEYDVQEKLTAARATLMTATINAQRFADSQSSQAKINEQVHTNKERILFLNNRRVELQQSLDRQLNTIAKICTLWNRAEEQARTHIAQLEAQKQQLDNAVPAVLQFINGGIATSITKARDGARNAESTLSDAMKEAAALRSEVSQIQKLLDDQHRNLTELEEHIRHLELLRSVEDDRQKLLAVEEQLTKLKTERLGGIESLLGPSSANENVSKIRELLVSKIAELDRTRAQHEGNVEAITREIAELRATLSGKKYDAVEKRYNAVFLKVQTTAVAVQDIEKYYKALDKAVQSYHQDKIQQVNQLIAELWRQTYRGSDIDTIEVKSEDDTNSTAARRSYNYRVVMRRGTSELDMRGRCSAGQKVLASVVIRLALSEAFCCDCGILALDEPTTNLDEDNSRSLAEALRELINSRRSLKHFQLIVITHDEQFVRALGSQSKDNFYYVQKDREGAFSVISERTFDQLFS